MLFTFDGPVADVDSVCLGVDANRIDVSVINDPDDDADSFCVNIDADAVGVSAIDDPEGSVIVDAVEVLEDV